jgi:uncharacterized protein (DUF1015 family)
VPRFSPFAGVRYDTSRADGELGALVAPPYDVIDDDQRAALEAAHACNSVRLILPRDEEDGDRYQRAAELFRRWQSAGILVRDASPRFYAYRMEFTDPHGVRRHTQGVIGALALPESGDESVLPHERTLPKAKSDRLALLTATRANFDPIWVLSLSAGLTELLRNATLLGACVDVDGTRHEIAAIDAPADIAAVSELVAATPVVLADGHHRFETACNYRNQHRDGGADAIMALVVELAEDELCIEPIHRTVDLPDAVDLRSRLADAFTVRDAGANTPENIEALEQTMRSERALGLVDAHGLALAIPLARTEDIDSGLVEELVVPRLPEAQWQYRHDSQAVGALVDKRVVSAAILCNPVSVAQTRAVAEAGERMPQKTTFFWPKPRTGMVLRSLD